MSDTLPQPDSTIQHKKIASLNFRYFFKISGNLANLLINLVAQSLIPRSLGPAGYGQYNFITSFFAQATSFLDMGTSTAFFTKLSKRPHDRGLVTFYFLYMLFLGLCLILFIGLSHIFGLFPFFWPDQQVSFVYFGAGLSFLMWDVQVFFGMADAYGLTIGAEKVRVAQRIIFLIIVILLYWQNSLTLTTFFGTMYLSLFLLLIGIGTMIRFSGGFFPTKFVLPFRQVKQLSREFLTYSRPLIYVSITGLITGILDRWLLQRFSGSIQQGFFGLSYQIHSICVLFSSAMIPLLMREFSIAFQEHNLPEMGRLFRRYIPLLYSIAAFFSCFLAIEAGEVVTLFGGSAFAGAILPVQIMAFFPMHATYGQLSSSLFFATDRTRLYSKICSLSLILGIPVTFFLVATPELGGLGSGAAGLAVKMLIFQFITINCLLYFNAKFLNLVFWKYLAHQILCPVTLLGMAFLARYTMLYLYPNMSSFLSFFITGFMYSMICVIVLMTFPSIFGLYSKDTTTIKNKLSSLAHTFHQ